MNEIKILIITSCSGEKKINVDNPAIAKEIDNIELRIKKEEELKEYKLTAKEMFISNQNIILNLAISNIKNIDICYLSSAYGLINQDELVIPYDINFSAMSLNDIDNRSKFLKINEESYYKCKNYDLIFFLLNIEYIRFLNLPINLPESKKQIFIISSKDEKFLSNIENIYYLAFSIDEIYKFNMHLNDFRAKIIKIICKEYKNDNKVFLKIYNNPLYIRDIISNYLYKDKFEQLNFFDT
ncbi:MAG: hypothetical protein KatS3mg068_1602 [Candidatus Sericytochromatia bacterium]|nr:MAG: hypothetical protein KatS3mg068_1602 [Candidatus Sericytochromatia bacterium]